MAKNQAHFTPDGKRYTGLTHKAGGVLMTGAKHTASSKPLTHEMPKKKKPK